MYSVWLDLRVPGYVRYYYVASHSRNQTAILFSHASFSSARVWLSVISHFSVHARIRVVYYFIFHDWCMPDRGQGGCTYRTDLVSSRTSTYHSAMTSRTPVPWQLLP